MNILSLIWGKTASTLVLVVGAVAGLLGLRWHVRGQAKGELREQIQLQTLEAIASGNEAANSVHNASDDDLRQRMRDEGWLK